MIEEINHKNLWAEKLQQVWLPSVDESWTGMRTILNKEMPIAPAKKWRRWLLLILFLLLVLGICTCPGRIHLSNQSENSGSPNINHHKKQDNTPPGRKYEKRKDTAYVITNQKSMPVKTDNRDHHSTNSEINDLSTIAMNRKVNNHSNKKKRPIKNIYSEDVMTYDQPNKQNKTGSDTKKNPHNHYKIKKINGGKTTIVAADKKPFNNKEPIASTTETTIGSSPSPNQVLKSHDSVSEQKMNSLLNKKDSLYTVKKNGDDSSSKKNKKPANQPIKKGWALGIGINQFFPIAGQQRSGFNSNGTNGSITDYIPVPMARYYFSNKIYVQLEFQFNVPQYTKQLLATQTTDSVSGITQSVYIKKLYYFNIPLSIHYNLLENLFVGAGLQYSRLSNGIALYEDRQPSFSGVDSVLSAKIKNFKNDSLYSQLASREWRFILDINYQWKKLTLGVQYNQAFKNFIDINVSNLQITQAHNNSLQVYLRYILWQSKKNKNLSPK